VTSAISGVGAIACSVTSRANFAFHGHTSADITVSKSRSARASGRFITELRRSVATAAEATYVSHPEALDSRLAEPRHLPVDHSPDS
jgi:hypothetical protein